MQKKQLLLIIAAFMMVGVVVGSWWLTYQYVAYIGSESVSYDILSYEKLKNYENIVPIAIIGSGSAGLASAVYGARSFFHTVIFEGKTPGGQLTTTSWVENWPGLKKKLGTDIINGLREQAQSFGARIVPETIVGIDASEWPFVLTTEDGLKIHALTVIIATGADPRKLGVPGEKEYWGKGVTTCAICDAPFYKDNDVVVVGGGDSAVEEALQLAPYAKNIKILVRGSSMRASAAMQERLKDYSHIQVLFNTHITEIKGGPEHVSSIDIVSNGTPSNMLIDGVFLAIGHVPNSQLVKDVISLDNQGYIVLKDRTQQTSRAGIFAAGDVADHQYRQAGVAAGDGIKAALDAADFLRNHGLNDTLMKQITPQFYDPSALSKKISLKLIKNIDELERILASTHLPVAVDFYTQYCPSCLQMLPVLETVAAQLDGKAIFVKVDALASRDLAEKYVVPTVPTLLVFKDASLVARTKEIMSRSQLQSFMEQFLVN